MSLVIICKLISDETVWDFEFGIGIGIFRPKYRGIGIGIGIEIGMKSVWIRYEIGIGIGIKLALTWNLMQFVACVVRDFLPPKKSPLVNVYDQGGVFPDVRVFAPWS